MLETLATDFSNGWLPFFWNGKLNLLANLYDDEVEDYANKLQQAYNTLRQYKFAHHLSFKRCLTHFEVCIHIYIHHAMHVQHNISKFRLLL